MGSIHEGHRQRMKAKLRGLELESFEEHEVLEMLLYYSIRRGDVNPLAHELIKRFGSLQEVLNAPYGQLLNVKGIGENSASLLHLVGGLRRYLERRGQKEHVKITGTWVAAQYCQSYIGESTQEKFALMHIDSGLRLKRIQLIAEGTMTELPVYIRQVAVSALENQSYAVILAHNHPSGDCKPSEADIEATKQIKKALGLLEINVADHIIVGRSNYYSFFAQRQVFDNSAPALTKAMFRFCDGVEYKFSNNTK